MHGISETHQQRIEAFLDVSAGYSFSHGESANLKRLLKLIKGTNPDFEKAIELWLWRNTQQHTPALSRA